MEKTERIRTLARAAKQASHQVAVLPTPLKNQALSTLADELNKKKPFLKEENEKDVRAAEDTGLSTAALDRLTLTDRVITAMAEGLIEVARLPDPVGEVVRMWKRPNDLLVGRVRIPLGVIGIIYESRPTVTVDAASLCLKSGNAVILRGGKEAFHSNRALALIMQDVLKRSGIPDAAIQLIPLIEREAVYEMLTLVCHIFVDASATEEMAEAIILNAKVQRPGVCNALETLLIHDAIAPSFLPRIVASLRKRAVEVRVCKRSLAILPDLKEAQEDDWYQEYLDLILSIKLVSSMAEAIDHIERYGSLHTDVIVTSDYSNAQVFLQKVDSSVVMVNASTRFNDGNQLGLGSEIGISTTKLHAFGPMGLQELTTLKYVVYGNGQIRA
jgi:glutamate-5-semialdehyde dehydrogenase